MVIETFESTGNKIAKVASNKSTINTLEDAIDLLGNLYFENFDRVILYEENFNPQFFDLKNRMAGKILQKFSTYRIRMAIVGDFAQYTSGSLKDFIYESNKMGHINFVSSTEEAIKILSEE